MTLDEAIKHAEEIAEENENKAQMWHKLLKNRIAGFSDLQAENNCIKCAEEHRRLAEWLKDYKRLLEQQPCEDCISREETKQFLYERIDRLNDDELYDIFSKIIDDMYNELPSVTPQPKMGRWMTWKEAGNDIPSETRFECSVCHDAAQTLCNGLDLLSTYCPNCGAKMQEVKE